MDRTRFLKLLALVSLIPSLIASSAQAAQSEGVPLPEDECDIVRCSGAITFETPDTPDPDIPIPGITGQNAPDLGDALDGPDLPDPLEIVGDVLNNGALGLANTGCGIGVNESEAGNGGLKVKAMGGISCNRNRGHIVVKVCLLYKKGGTWVPVPGKWCEKKTTHGKPQAIAKASGICPPGTHKFKAWAYGSAGRFGGSVLSGVNKIGCRRNL